MEVEKPAGWGCDGGRAAGSRTASGFPSEDSEAIQEKRSLQEGLAARWTQWV